MSYWKSTNEYQGLPSTGGVYVLLRNNEVLYVGQSIDLNNRVLDHGWIISQHGVDTRAWGFLDGAIVKYRASRRFGDWAAIELRLIRKLRPTYNLRVLELRPRKRRRGANMSGGQKAKRRLSVTEIHKLATKGAGDNLIGLRDRAIILLGAAAQLRACKLASLCVEDCLFHERGLTLDTANIYIPRNVLPEICPVVNTENWIKEAQLKTGPVFRTINRHAMVAENGMATIDIGRVIKKCAELAGLDPHLYAGDSLHGKAA